MKSSNQKRTKATISAFAVSILVGAISSAALAQPLATTDTFLTAHPDVAQQLNEHPRLIDDPQYIAQHPELHEYLRTHPKARVAWHTHPFKYLRHEHHYQQTH